MRIFFSLSCFLICLASLAHAAPEWPRSDANCVRWEAQKRMLLVKEVHVQGLNCRVKVTVNKTAAPAVTAAQQEPSVTPIPNIKRTVVATIPIKGFDSGEPERDATVYELLGGDAHPNLTFVSSPLDPETWSRLTSGNLAKVSGKLQIASNRFPITLRLSFKGDHIVGTTRGPMTNFKVKPPVLGGGAIAKVRNTVGLSFRIQRALLQSQ